MTALFFINHKSKNMHIVLWRGVVRRGAALQGLALQSWAWSCMARRAVIFDRPIFINTNTKGCKFWRGIVGSGVVMLGVVWCGTV